MHDPAPDCADASAPTRLTIRAARARIPGCRLARALGH
jgi:hypothetical protein